MALRVGFRNHLEKQGEMGQATKAIKPFLRWAGGKRHLLQHITSLLTEDLKGCMYREPFLGGGSLFFFLRPARAVLSDANEHLIGCYRFVRDYPPLVARYLREHRTRSCEEYYYLIREQYNRGGFSPAQAARFIYLNKTCFNGIFRVNKRGSFNVPYGRKEPPVLPTLRGLVDTSRALRAATLRCSCFEEEIAKARDGDFVYLDPPYPALNGTAYFTHYTPERFGEKDQRRVAEAARELAARGCRVLVTNADTPEIRRLYKGFFITSIRVTRYITCKARKHRVRELIVTNYKDGERHG